MKKLLIIILTTFSTLAAQSKGAKEVIELINKVNTCWQSSHKPECRGFWDNAAYFTGNNEVAQLTGNQKYYDYAKAWCEHNKWKGATQTDPAKWQYKQYGEGMNHVLFADWQICFQVYIEMYKHAKENSTDSEIREQWIERAKEVMNYQAQSAESDYWWWADALYMGMPVFTKLYTITKDEKLLDKQYECFRWTDELLFDKEVKLYYRDGKYVWPKVTTSCSGGKSFWARGCGWVLAGLAKVLQDLPKDSKYRPFYEQRFKDLAQGVIQSQQKEGYWSRSMLCEGDAPGYETSGTAFFTYGLLWGVNNGLLNKSLYKSHIKSAWKYLSTVALQSDGTIGYVQPIGEKPDPTRTVDSHSQAPFGTGAWLLAACEYYKYIK